jgi:hypothetical protein
MIFNLVLGIITTIILISFPGYIFISLLKTKTKSFLLNYFMGLMAVFSFLIIEGFILSYFNLFKFNLLISSIIFLNLISFSFLIKKKQRLSLHMNNQEKVIVIMFILMIVVGLVYSLNSNLPIGFDRGKHFGMSVFLANNHHLSSTVEGTNYNPFYFQGQNILLTFLTRTSLMYGPQDFNSIDSIKMYSLIFKFYFNFIVALSILALYFLAKSLYRDQNLILFCCFSFLIFSFSLIKTGSIGVVLAFIYVIIFLSLLNHLAQKVKNKNKKGLRGIYSLLVLILFMIMLIHVIGFFVVLVFSIMLALISLKKREGRFNFFKTIFLIFVLSGILYSIFLIIFKQELFFGIFQEIVRKKFGTTNIGESVTMISYIAGYFKKNLSNIGLMMLVTSPLIILGFITLIIKKRFKVILFFMSVVLFILFPILGLPKTTIYLIYPLSIFLGNGIYYLNKKFNRGKILTIFIIFLLVTISFFQVTKIDNYSKSKLYVVEEDYFNSLNLIKTLNNKKIGGNILFYSSGEVAYFINGLSNHKILFADPRYPDLPQSIELSRLYNEYSTKYEVYSSQITPNEFNEIILKNNLSLIISSTKKELIYLTNLEQINMDQQKYIIHINKGSIK